MIFFENDIKSFDNTCLNVISCKHPVYSHSNKIIATFGLNFILSEGDEIFFGEQNLSGIFKMNFSKLDLSKRQVECLKWLIRGMTIKQIAKKLILSPKTVEHYIEALKKRLNCKSRSDLIEKAYEMGLVKHF